MSHGIHSTASSKELFHAYKQTHYFAVVNNIMAGIIITITLMSPSLGTIPVRFIGVIRGVSCWWFRARMACAQTPKLRKGIVERLDGGNTGGLTLPDCSGRRLRRCLIRKEQIGGRITDAPGKLTNQEFAQTREFGGAELAHPFVKFEVV